jgi:hypothetical protein
VLGPLVLAARLLLTAVLAAAALGKLADRHGTRRAARGLGAPEPLAVPLAIAVPLAELALAGLLLPGATAGPAAAAAAALLLVFSSAIGRAIRRGRSVDCRCFGAIGAAPIGPRMLARNGALAAIALFVVVAALDDPGPSAFPWVAAALAAVAAIVLAPRRGRRPQPSSAPAGPAPAFSLRALDGEDVALDDLLERGRPVALVFADTSATSWRGLAVDVEEWQRYGSHLVTVAVVTAGVGEAATTRLDHVLLDPDRRVQREYGAEGEASAVVVSSYGAVVGSPAVGRAAIGDLVRRVLAEDEEQPELWEDGLPQGEPAPDVALRGLDGRSVRLGEAMPGETVVLFWAPGCRPCRGLYEEVRAWERSRPTGAPRLVVISAGDPEQAAVDRFASDVLVDDELEARAAFAVPGAPTAVLVAADGRIASPIAVGARAVLALLRRPA